MDGNLVSYQFVQEDLTQMRTHKLFIAMTYVVLWSLLLTPSLAAATPPVQSGEVTTETTVGVANSRVLISFDGHSGALTSLKNLATGDEYLKVAGGDGNPFRAYVDTTELPRVLKQGRPWPTPPVEDAMGGTLVDPKQCRLEQSQFGRSGGAGVLRLVMRAEQLKLAFDVEVTVPDTRTECIAGHGAVAGQRERVGSGGGRMRSLLPSCDRRMLADEVVVQVRRTICPSQ